MSRLFDEGQIPPFAIVFPETQEGYLIEKNKPGKQIIQFSFLLTNVQGHVLPYARTQFAVDEAEAGHRISLGRSVLVGWSPVTAVNGRIFPQCEDDMRDALNREVTRRTREPVPQIQFLGLARRNVKLKTGQSTRYYFYIFECRYSGLGPVGESLVKDVDDRLEDAFVPVNDELLRTLQNNKVDLRALEAFTGRDLSAFCAGQCDLLKPEFNDSPPFLVRSPGVFFCHSSQDKPKVQELATRLEQIGIPTWVDQERLQPGDIWFRKAFEAVKYCQVFVYVASSNSLVSNPCRDELAHAMDRKKWLEAHGSTAVYHIIPIILDGERTRSHLPTVLGDAQCVDLRQQCDREQGATAFVDRIKSIIPPIAQMLKADSIVHVRAK